MVSVTEIPPSRSRIDQMSPQDRNRELMRFRLQQILAALLSAFPDLIWKEDLALEVKNSLARQYGPDISYDTDVLEYDLLYLRRELDGRALSWFWDKVGVDDRDLVIEFEGTLNGHAQDVIG